MLECDRWWEPETEWHRTWKAQFPEEWQEVPHIAASGERHIADVKTDAGWVIELQHSPISLEERSSREGFYKSMVWVVDGLRYKRDLGVFREALAGARIVNDDPMYLEPYTWYSGVLQRWAPSQCPVYIDFGEEEFRVAGFALDVPVLWHLLLKPDGRGIVVAGVTKESFKQFFQSGSPIQNIVVFRDAQPQGRRLWRGHGRA